MSNKTNNSLLTVNTNIGQTTSIRPHSAHYKGSKVASSSSSLLKSSKDDLDIVVNANKQLASKASLSVETGRRRIFGKNTPATRSLMDTSGSVNLASLAEPIRMNLESSSGDGVPDTSSSSACAVPIMAAKSCNVAARR